MIDISVCFKSNVFNIVRAPIECGKIETFICEKPNDGESFQPKDTKVPSEPRYDLRKRSKSKEQQNSVLFLIQKFENLSIHDMNEEILSKNIKERVDSRGLRFQVNI